MDNFVLVLGQKKTVLKMQKEYEDLVGICQCCFSIGFVLLV